MDAFDIDAVKAREDSILRDNFLQNHESFILSLCKNITGRFITKSDDEWSIALLAFSEALDGYDSNRGHFAPYAKLVIKSRLIDYARKQLQHSVEIPTTPSSLNSDNFEHSDFQLRKKSFSHRLLPDTRISDEVEILSKHLQSYNIRFEDLSVCSPKASKSKKQCAQIFQTLKENPDLVNSLIYTHKLPIQELQSLTGFNRKIIERYRKYIIAVVEVWKGDYPLLMEYIPFLNDYTNI